MTFENIAKKRRSINFFDPKRTVPENVLKQLVEHAALTPSSFNLQPWNLLVLKEAEEKEKLKKLAWDQPKVVEAPVVFVVLADRNGWQENHPVLETVWKEFVKTGAMQEEQREWFLSATSSLYNWGQGANLAFAAKNAGFFAMSLMYAATGLGLESHPMDGFDHEAVKKAFNIPDHFWVPVLIAVGYPSPDLELHPPKWRKSYDEIVTSF